MALWAMFQGFWAILLPTCGVQLIMNFNEYSFLGPRVRCCAKVFGEEQLVPTVDLSAACSAMGAGVSGLKGSRVLGFGVQGPRA